MTAGLVGRPGRGEECRRAFRCLLVPLGRASPRAGTPRPGGAARRGGREPDAGPRGRTRNREERPPRASRRAGQARRTGVEGGWHPVRGGTRCTLDCINWLVRRSTLPTRCRLLSVQRCGSPWVSSPVTLPDGSSSLSPSTGCWGSLPRNGRCSAWSTTTSGWTVLRARLDVRRPTGASRAVEHGAGGEDAHPGSEDASCPSGGRNGRA